MKPTCSGGVFDDTDTAALLKAGCTSVEVWGLGIFAERFSEKGRKSLALIFIHGMEKGLPFKRIFSQCEQSWQDILTFSAESDLHDTEHPSWGVANSWAFNDVRKTLKLGADKSTP